jgi:hypothetical protein
MKSLSTDGGRNPLGSSLRALAALTARAKSEPVNGTGSQPQPVSEDKLHTEIPQQPGLILKWQTDLFEHGKRRAIDSGALEPQAADVAALESHASAIAREAHRTAFDATQVGTHDHLRDSEHKKVLRDRDEAEPAVKFATAEVREREIAAAQAYPGEPPPPVPLALRVAAVVAISITTAPTLHDCVFLIPDDFIAWFVSLVCGLFLGLWITLMILGDPHSGPYRSATNWIGLGSGIFISLALGALRLKGACTVGDYIFAIAMTILDLGIVLGLESVASTRRTRYADWHTGNTAWEQAKKALEMANVHLERCKDRLKQLNDAIAAHIDYVEERALRFFHIDQIEATLLKAVRDGYHAGIAQNRGRILGTWGNNHA